MSGTTGDLGRKIASAGDLQGVVRTMKFLAASSIGQYDRSVRALIDYYRTMALALGACIRDGGQTSVPNGQERSAPTGAFAAIVVGSDLGLVGRFNESIVAHASQALAALPGTPRIWAVGERVHSRLVEAHVPPVGTFTLPSSIAAIAPVVGRILLALEPVISDDAHGRVCVYHNRPVRGALYEPIGQRLLPLDAQWQRGMSEIAWPGRRRPEILGGAATTLRRLIREYLFISLFRACAESMASENASRLSAMQRADTSIDDRLVELRRTFHHERQAAIDEELFDVMAGFETLASELRRTRRTR